MNYDNLIENIMYSTGSSSNSYGVHNNTCIAFDQVWIITLYMYMYV